MDVITAVMVLFSVLAPTKTWFAPDQPMTVKIEKGPDCTLVMRDFAGKQLVAAADASIKAGQTVDLRSVFPDVSKVGAYIVSAAPNDKSAEFVGTPLVITTRGEEPGGPPGPIVSKVEPLCYAKMTTDLGDLSMLFYYDVAPNTSANFLSLAAGGYYDGLKFHRVLPGFVIQGGDPRGDGSGGPGYTINAEFNDRVHEEGVLSMARQGDAGERAGNMPGPKAANSAGSQFFICLSAEGTRHLNGRYTAFGKVFSGMDVVRKIAAAPAADPASGTPVKPVAMQSVRVVPVTAKDNPYQPAAIAQPAPERKAQ